MRTFGENLKEEREKKGIKQKDLANWLDVKPNTVWRWECGDREPHASKVRQMAEIFGVTVSYLMRGADEPAEEFPKIERPVELLEEKEALPTNTKKFRGKIYVDGKALDTLACQLRDRLNIEYEETDPGVLSDVKEALHECLRIYEDHKVKQQLA